MLIYLSKTMRVCCFYERGEATVYENVSLQIKSDGFMKGLCEIPSGTQNVDST